MSNSLCWLDIGPSFSRSDIVWRAWADEWEEGVIIKGKRANCSETSSGIHIQPIRYYCRTCRWSARSRRWVHYGATVLGAWHPSTGTPFPVPRSCMQHAGFIYTLSLNHLFNWICDRFQVLQPPLQWCSRLPCRLLNTTSWTVFQCHMVWVVTLTFSSLRW
jgi:hypothetical protein